MQKHVPVAYVREWQPRPGLAGFDAPTPIMAYEYLILANAKVPDETVYQLAKILHANPKELGENFAPLRGFEPDRMITDMPGLEVHPGAIRFYEEVGQWPPKK